jgi:hypothetical protein
VPVPWHVLASTAGGVAATIVGVAVSARVAQAQMAFVNTARRALDASQRPLDTQLGGPPLD